MASENGNHDTDKLVAVFLAAAVAFLPPMLSLADGRIVAGLPAIWLYLFGVWTLAIITSARLARHLVTVHPPPEDDAC